jgi:hypothetical protein
MRSGSPVRGPAHVLPNRATSECLRGHGARLGCRCQTSEFITRVADRCKAEERSPGERFRPSTFRDWVVGRWNKGVDAASEGHNDSVRGR